MLTIRREQMEALSAYMRQRFEDRMIRYIATAFPNEFNKLCGTAHGDLKVREFVQAGVAKAKRYRISSEGDIASYIEFMVVTGADFEEQPEMRWAKNILVDDSLSGHGKAVLLDRRLPEFRPDRRRSELLSKGL